MKNLGAEYEREDGLPSGSRGATVTVFHASPLSLVEAAQAGDLAWVEHYISTPGGSPNSAKALRVAAHYGHVEVVRRLLSLSPAESCVAEAFESAAGAGQESVVSLLLSVPGALGSGNRALALAVMNGHDRLVDVLLPVCDPRAQDSFPLAVAIAHKRMNLLPVLAPHSDVLKVFKDVVHQKQSEPMGMALCSFLPLESLAEALVTVKAEETHRAYLMGTQIPEWPESLLIRKIQERMACELEKALSEGLSRVGSLAPNASPSSHRLRL